MKTKVPQEYAGIRLDKALVLLLPDMGVRGRRRLADEGRVLVDGTPRNAAYKVRGGQELEIVEEGVPVRMPEGVRVLACDDEYAFFFKPSGLHTAAIAGRGNGSLETFLPVLLPAKNYLLVNRLDEPTSGIVVAASDEGNAAAFRVLEDTGEVRKTYLAAVYGRVEAGFTVRTALDMSRRRKTKVLEAEAPSLRWTDVRPVLFDSDRGVSLLEVNIRKGARHQIRAHLAHAGYPILGDSMYGPAKEGGRLYLHHYRIELAGREVVAEPDWPEWPEWEKKILLGE